MDTYFDKLLEQYDKICDEAVYGKKYWKLKADIVTCVLLTYTCIIFALLLLFIILEFSMSEPLVSLERFENVVITLLCAATISHVLGLLIIICVGNIDAIKANLVSADFLNDWLEATSGCKIREVKNTYDVSFKEMSQGANNAKIGRIKLLSKSAPSLLLSLRGKDGPVGRPTLSQDFRLLGDTDTDFAPRDSMPGITRSQFAALPDTVTLPQLAVELFPDWVDDEVDTEHWIFTVADLGVQDELKEALDTLAVTILKLLIIESMEKAIEQNTPLSHEHSSVGFAYPRSELIRILNSENTDSPYAEEIKRLVEKVETIAVSNRPLIGTNIIPKIETTVPA